MQKMPAGIMDTNMKGILLPQREEKRSLNHAIKGSVTASNKRPEAKIRENIVKKPKTPTCGTMMNSKSMVHA